MKVVAVAVYFSGQKLRANSQKPNCQRSYPSHPGALADSRRFFRANQVRKRTMAHRAFFTKPLFRAGSVPHYVHDPPAETVVEQLDTVHASFERWPVRAAERLIEAQYMCEVARCFGLAACLPLPEVLHCEYRLHAVNEIFSAQETHPGLFSRNGDDRHQASARQNKRPEPVPVPRLANRSGNSFVEGMQNGIERRNI